MKRVGIISLYHNSYNYGGVLQAFALNHILESMGYDAEQIDYAPQRKSHAEGTAKRYLREHSRLQLAAKALRSLNKKIYGKTLGTKEKKGFAVRRKAFDQFKRQYMHASPVCNSSDIREVCSGYDVLICGSDQIWKPTVVDDAYMLAFAREQTRRFSYAASLSVDTLAEHDQKRYAAWLQHLDGISVREESSVSLLTPLTDKPVEWVCDPTLLIAKETWMDLAKEAEPASMEAPYLFCYFLGDDAVFRRNAKAYAKKHHLKIVMFPNLQQKPVPADNHFGDVRVYDASPLRFVKLIQNAQCVMTDSFHATAFSLNLNVPFFVFERSAITSMNARILSILSAVSCEDRFMPDCRLVYMESDKEIDWDTVNSALGKMRETSLNYLTKWLV